MPQTPIKDNSVSPDDVYVSLLRSLRRRKGFGLVFVNCTPARSTQFIEEIRRDLPLKQVGVMELKDPVDTLRDLVAKRDDIADLNILVINGLEKSLEADIKPGYGGEGDYYNLNTIPPILNHLNQQRENFRDRFGHLCFVFLLPLYAVKYMVRRAPDFFDWGTGVIELPTDWEIVERASSRLLGRVSEYLNWTRAERDRRILHIQTWLAECKESPTRQSELFREQGDLFLVSERFEEAIASYDKAIAFKLGTPWAWNNRGIALAALGQSEEALASYDQAIESGPGMDFVFFNRGKVLGELGRIEEAIASFEKVIGLNPSNHSAWDNHGYSLTKLGKYREAIDSFDRALQIEPDSANATYNKAFCISMMGDRDGALEWLKKAIDLDAKYREMAKTDKDFAGLRDDPGFRELVQF